LSRPKARCFYCARRRAVFTAPEGALFLLRPEGALFLLRPEGALFLLRPEGAQYLLRPTQVLVGDRVISGRSVLLAVIQTKKKPAQCAGF
jgi:hypothetical protein